MSEALSVAQLTELQEEFRATRATQDTLALLHEQSGSFGLAYLAKWAAAESFAKTLGPICQRALLKVELHEWLVYLQADTRAKPPPKIGAGKFDLAKTKTNKIPAENSLKLVLPAAAAPSFYKLLAISEKFRVRRNVIAHSGEGVSDAVYADFKRQTEAAAAEIEAWLRSAIAARQRRVSGANKTAKGVKR